MCTYVSKLVKIDRRSMKWISDLIGRFILVHAL